MFFVGKATPEDIDRIKALGYDVEDAQLPENWGGECSSSDQRRYVKVYLDFSLADGITHLETKCLNDAIGS